MSREINEEEARYLFLEHMASLVRYWAKTECRKHIDHNEDQISYRLSGLMHSTLAALDGSACALPGYILQPDPHKDDQKFAIENEHDYYPCPPKYDITGGLASQLHRHIKKEVEKPDIVTFAQSIDKRHFIKSIELPPEPLTYMVDKNLDKDLLESLQERFGFPISNKEAISPKELANGFLKIHDYWFEDHNNLADKRDEVFAVCFAWANCRLDITDKNDDLSYVLRKFREEYFNYFTQKSPKPLF